MNECRVKAPAKINLSLDITDKRHDGYHILHMVLQTVSLCDYLTVSLTDGEGIAVTCDKDYVPLDGSNLAYKAATAFFERNKLAPRGVRIDIEKNIPMEAGLAGGSADAAATLVALNYLLDTKLTTRELCEIGVDLGADVPFCIQGGTVMAEGIGEIFDPLPALTDCYFVIAKPDGGTRTADAYALFDKHFPLRRPDTEMMVAAVTTANLECIGKEMCNVLEEVCNVADVEQIKQRMLENEALGAVMSGSGSAVVGLFETKAKAKKCMSELEESYQQVYIAKPCDYGATVIED